MGVSAVVLTYNNAGTITACLESLEWVDELVVVDSYSDDGTREILESKADIVIQKPRAGPGEPYDHYRRDGFDAAANEWVVTIDADEWIPETLAGELRTTAKEDRADVVFCPKKNFVADRWIDAGFWWPDFSVVLLKRECVSISPTIHDFFDIDGDARRLELPPDGDLAVRHRLYDSYTDAFRTNHRYGKIRARQESFNIKKLLAFPYTFWYIYVHNKSYRAGIPGFVLSIAHSFYRTEAVYRALYYDLVD